MTRTTAPALLVVTLAGALTGGCASSVEVHPAEKRSAAATVIVNRTAPAGPAPSAAGLRTAVTSNDNGRTLEVAPGTVIEVRLDSTYWLIAPSPVPAVVVGTPAVVTPIRTGPPGMGRGSVAVRFRAVGPGRVRLSASRTTCGEALRCSPAQGSFGITVVVS